METFSSKVKKELSTLNNLAKKKIVKAELKGYLITSNQNSFSTENQYNINRFSKLLNNIGERDYSIKMVGNKFCIKPKNRIQIEEIGNSEEEIKALSRGAFMATGSITNPESVYHLEIIFEDKQKADELLESLKNYGISFGLLKRKNKYVLYAKEGEAISDFLAFIEANKSKLDFEEKRVVKEIRNNINRQVNCETANLNKTVQASVKQIEDIKLIKKKKKYDKLTEKEKEIAELRLKNPNASLVELGNMLVPKISKSGVIHRIDGIGKLANELKNNK